MQLPIHYTIFGFRQQPKSVALSQKNCCLNLRQHFGNGFSSVGYASVFVDYRQRCRNQDCDRWNDDPKGEEKIEKLRDKESPP